MTDLRKIIIDDTEVEVDPNLTLIQACEQAGIEIPRFCYHERLSIAGNCRMCLVEVVGGPPKPAASCAMQVKDLRPGPNGEPSVIKTEFIHVDVETKGELTDGMTVCDFGNRSGKAPNCHFAMDVDHKLFREMMFDILSRTA